MPATIRDVAAKAGVSISTVSRVLNSTARVNEAKERKVKEAIQQLGFVPNEVARNLVQKKTGGIGVVLPSIGGEFFSEFLHGLDVTTRSNGVYLLVSASHGSLDEMKQVLVGMHQRVDGLVIMTPAGDGAFAKLEFDKTPIVVINADATASDHATINFDNFRGAYLATEHLLHLGHRRIAILKGPASTFDALERLRGYRASLQSHQISVDTRLEIDGDYSPASGMAAASVLMSLEPRPTAIFCANDQSAVALMNSLQHRGIRVPDDLSMVGFDDIPGAAYSSPPLTTVRAGIQQLGVEAIECLIDLMENNRRPAPHRVLPAELVVRESTASLRT